MLQNPMPTSQELVNTIIPLLREYTQKVDEMIVHAKEVQINIQEKKVSRSNQVLSLEFRLLSDSFNHIRPLYQQMIKYAETLVALPGLHELTLIDLKIRIKEFEQSINSLSSLVQFYSL